VKLVRQPLLGIVALAWACSGSPDRKGGGSVTARVPPPLDPAVAAVMHDYHVQQINADSAATLLMDYSVRTGRPVDIDMDPPLRDAIIKEGRRRSGRTGGVR